MDRILAHDNPRHLVQQIPAQDFYWLVKKVGDDDCIPLLRMASDVQKQHLLDLEMWEGDRPNPVTLSLWFARLHLADPRGLIQWFRTHGESLAYYYFFKKIRVEIRNDEETQDLEGKFTLDGTFYVSTPDTDEREIIEGILRSLAAEDFEQYQRFLATLGGVIPAEMEEDLYRMRNVRLAEHGFLPAEEAMAVYSRFTPDKLALDEPAASVEEFSYKKIRELVAVSPLLHVQGDNLLTRAFSEIEDPYEVDRIRLEFAGLCNQIIAADGMGVNDLDALIRTCKKAAAHMNLALEKVCGSSVSMAQGILNKNNLISLFRVGFGLVLDFKWEAERWVKESWFFAQGLEISFWGEAWGNRLKGILKKKPFFYQEVGGEGAYTSFEHISEIETCRTCLNQLKVLDQLFAGLTRMYPPDTGTVGSVPRHFRHVLFNLWARQILNLSPGFSGLKKDQAVLFFPRLRRGEEGPPYEMSVFKDVFINDFVACAAHLIEGSRTDLKEVLQLIWKEFVAEYAYVDTNDLDERYGKYIEIA